MATLTEYLTNIANAIRNKKGTTDKINAQNFASEIESIEAVGSNLLQNLVTGKGADGGYYLFYNYKGTSLDFLSDIDFSAITRTEYMFGWCSKITSIPLINTSNVTDMESMFYGCWKLTTIPQFDTSKVTTMSSMFYGCEKLNTIPQLDTSKVKFFSTTFYDCHELTTIPQIDASSATSMYYMFFNCHKLETIDVTKLADGGLGSFVRGCYSLTKLIIRTMDTIPTYGQYMFSDCYHFLGTKNDTYNPNGLKDGRIYVPDAQVDSLKATAGWDDYADIIVPLSTLVE